MLEENMGMVTTNGPTTLVPVAFVALTLNENWGNKAGTVPLIKPVDVSMVSHEGFPLMWYVVGSGTPSA